MDVTASVVGMSRPVTPSSMTRYPSGCVWIVVSVLAVLPARFGSAQLTPVPGFVACSVTLGLSPTALAVGDFNQDGTPDTAVLNGASSQVTVLLSNRSDFAQGACQQAVGSPTPFAVGTGNPTAIAAGDVDQNGSIDLVVAGLSGVVIARNSSGSFSPEKALFAGTNPTAVAIADVDGDGRADIVVGSNDGVAILYGNGSNLNGGFDAAAIMPVVDPATQAAVTVSAIVVNTLNKDNYLDVAAVSNTNNKVFTLLQDPNAPRTFTTLAPVSVGVSPTAVSAGDFNNDGVLDLAISSGGGNDRGVLGIFLGQLPGNPVTPFVLATSVNTGATQASTGTNPVALGLYDFNRDGALDVVVANKGNATVPFFLGDGSGGVNKQPGNCGGSGNDCSAGASRFPVALQLADVDGDGRADVILANQGTPSLTFLLSSKPGPTPSPTPTTSDTPTPTSTFTPTVTPTPGGNCCIAHDGPGCDDSNCNSCVSGLSPFCDTNQWDTLCVQIATVQCASVCLCGSPTVTPTMTAVPSATPTPPSTYTATATPTGSLPPTATATSTSSATPTGPTVTPTRTINPTKTATITATATRTASKTPIPGNTFSPTPQCFAAGVCVSGNSCAIMTPARGAGDSAAWLLLPLAWLWWRRAR